MPRKGIEGYAWPYVYLVTKHVLPRVFQPALFPLRVSMSQPLSRAGLRMSIDGQTILLKGTDRIDESVVGENRCNTVGYLKKAEPFSRS